MCEDMYIPIVDIFLFLPWLKGGNLKWVFCFIGHWLLVLYLLLTFYQILCVKSTTTLPGKAIVFSKGLVLCLLSGVENLDLDLDMVFCIFVFIVRICSSTLNSNSKTVVDYSIFSGSLFFRVIFILVWLFLMLGGLLRFKIWILTIGIFLPLIWLLIPNFKFRHYHYIPLFSYM
jgi:hypothetical protein